MSYTGSGSGAGLRAWHAESAVAGGVASSGDHWISTDDAPNETQISNISQSAHSASVAVIPVEQAAISIIANPPRECTITTIRNKALEEIYRGVVTTWESIGRGTGCAGRSIIPYVRQDSSGTTFQFKHYLWLINRGEIENIQNHTATERLTWLQLTASAENLNWPSPAASHLTHATTQGGGGLVAEVNTQAGAIGYANLADAAGRENARILRLQDNGTGALEEAVFVEPREAGGSNANCSNVVYFENLGTGGELERAERITLSTVWTNVFGSNPSIGGSKYSLCTLTYMVAVLNYATAGYTAEIGATVREYLRYITETTGGQEALTGHNYRRLTTALKEAAREIVRGIS